MSIVQWQPDLVSFEHIFLKEVFPKIRVGLVTPESNALVLVQQNSTKSGLHDRVNIIPLILDKDGNIDPKSTDRRITPDGKNVVKIKLPPQGEPCGFAIQVEAGSGKVQAILLVDKKGNLEKIECQYEVREASVTRSSLPNRSDTSGTASRHRNLFARGLEASSSASSYVSSGKSKNPL